MATPLVIAGVRLIDGTGRGVLEDAVVGIRDGRVVSAGSEVPALGADVIDANGLTLIPGLIDCHVHLCFDGNADFAGDAERMTEDDARARCAANAGRALEAGITTVRDLGGIGAATIDTARAQRSGEVTGARILTAGEVLTVPGGHAHFIGREVSSVEEMTKAVASLNEAGADVVKIVATGGVLTPGIGATQSAFPQDQLDACVAEAHRRGMRVAAHAIGAEGIDAAVRAGVDSIEHGCYLTHPIIEEMIAGPTWLVATLAAPDRISHGGGGVPDYARAKSDEVMEAHRASFARAVAEGVRIASGTDAGTPFNLHGGLAYELRLMHQTGMPLHRVLTAATGHAAQLLGLGDLGTIEPGRIADMVLLDGDPLTDVGAYEQVAMVIQGGRVVVDR